MMYGPFSAAYAGNSMGAVMEITTRLPDRSRASIEQTQALQTFDLYGTEQTSARRRRTRDVGDRFGKFVVLGERQLSEQSQPAARRTSRARRSRPAPPAASPTQNKLGAPANVLGATGLLHTRMTNAKAEGGLRHHADVARGVHVRLLAERRERPASTRNRRSRATPTFAGQAGFASGFYDLDAAAHVAQPVAAHATRGATGTSRSSARTYRFDTDQQRTPTTRVGERHDVRHGGPRRGARRHGLGDARPQRRVAPRRAWRDAHA